MSHPAHKVFWDGHRLVICILDVAELLTAEGKVKGKPRWNNSPCETVMDGLLKPCQDFSLYAKHNA